MDKIIPLTPNKQNICNNILFNVKKHQYLVNGELYKSVSETDKTFEWVYKKKINPHILKAAQLRGTQIHSAIELIITKKFNIDSFFEENKCSLPTQKKIRTLSDLLEKFLKDYDVLELEIPLADTEIHLVGTVDIILRRKIDGKIIVADWKSCSNEEGCKPTKYIKFLPQLIKYSYLVAQNFVDVDVDDISVMIIFIGEKELNQIIFSLDACQERKFQS